jgi:YrbI family 3-deoxy-D-manno-octulosonate 8-phosphate phosphatase
MARTTREARLISKSALSARIRTVRLVAFDFDGVFTDNSVYVFQDGREAVRCYRGDGIGLRKLERVGIKPIIISTEMNPIVSARAHKLRVDCVQGCEDKRAALEDVIQSMQLALSQVAFVGNDVNDLACLQIVGVPIIVQDAHPDLLPFAIYRTKARGGEGAVREVCDLIAQVVSETAALCT